MGRIEGTDREQIQLMSYENFIGEDNMVRVIDRFVDVCDLEKLGFQKMQPAQTGRPSYPPEAMAKLYVYGYENGIRSSRKIEKETLFIPRNHISFKRGCREADPVYHETAAHDRFHFPKASENCRICNKECLGNRQPQ